MDHCILVMHYGLRLQVARLRLSIYLSDQIPKIYYTIKTLYGTDKLLKAALYSKICIVFMFKDTCYV